MGRGQRAADGRGDVVVARGHVGDDRPEHVEGRTVAELFLELHVGRHLVQRHMPRSLDHHLHLGLPAPPGQLAEQDQLLDLGRVRGVAQAAGPQAVAQAEGHVELAADLQQSVEVLVKRVFPVVCSHPVEQQRATPADHVGEPRGGAQPLHRDAGQAGVDGHEVDAVLGVHAHHLEKIVHRDGGHVLAVAGHRVVYRHRAEHHRADVHGPAAEGAGVAKGGQVHDGVGLELDGPAHLVQFPLHVAAVLGHAEVDVDLGGQAGAHASCAQARVVAVGRDGDAAVGHALKQVGFADALVAEYLLHLRGEGALAGGGHLGGVGHGILRGKG